MRKLGIVVLVLVALVVIAALAIPYLVDVNRYHGRIQTELQQRLHRPVSLGQMHLRVIPLAFRVENPVIGEDQSFNTGKPFAQADELEVRAELFPLLRGDVQVSSLELKRPRIELVRNQQGVWNFSSLGSEAAMPAAPARSSAGNKPSAAQPPTSPQQQQQKQLSLNDLKITDGQIGYTDYQKRQPRAVYDHIDLRLLDFAPDKPFMIEAAAHLPGQGTQEIKLDGKGGPIAKNLPSSTPFKGTLELKQVSLSGFQKFVNSRALSGMDAIASGKADVASNGNQIESSGSLRLEQPRVRGVEIGYPITADYSVSDDLSKEALNIQKGNLKLGSTPISISGTINTAPTPPQLDVKLNTADVSIEEVARLAAAFGVAFNPNMKIAGHLKADLRAQGSASKPALNGRLSAANLNISGKDLPQPVQIQNIDLVMTPQEIRSNEFAATTGATAVTVQFALAQYTTPNSAVNANIRTANARLGEVLNIARAYGVSAVDGVTGDGNLSLDLHATGPLKNSAAMTFSGTGALQNAQLKSPNITQPVKIGNADIRFSQNSAVLEKLAASVGSSNMNGTLTMRNFASPQVQFTLAADKILAAEWQKMFNTGPAQRAAAAGFWNLVPAVEAAVPPDSFVNRTTGTGTLNVGGIVYDDLLLNNVRANVVLDHGIIKLDPVTSEVFGGRQVGAIVIDTRTAPVTYAVSSRLEKVDANKLLSSVSSLKQTLYGLLTANAQTHFASPTSTEIARTLNGRMSLNLSDGKLANVDLLYQLANIGKFLTTGKAISRKNFTSLIRLTGDFDVTNGVAQTNNLQAVTDAGTLAAQGFANLADQTLNMKVTAVIPKALSAQVGGNGIGGFMSTALANKNGELVMPVLVTGSFQKPVIAPDLETIARMKMENLLPTGSNPGQLTSGILGILGNKGQQQPAQPGQPAQPQQNGVQGILDKLSGKPSRQPASSPTQSPAQPNGAQQQPAAGQQQPTTAGQQPPEQPKKQGWADVLQGVLNKNKQQQPASQQQQQQQQQQQPEEQPKRL